nr:unnamed protein product [Spirometra erinaceieuropaei]
MALALQISKHLIRKGAFSGLTQLNACRTLVCSSNNLAKLGTAPQPNLNGMMLPSTHWTIERVVAISMLPMYPIALMYEPLGMEYVVAAAVSLHAYWGFGGVIRDYVMERRVGVVVAKSECLSVNRSVVAVRVGCFQPRGLTGEAVFDVGHVTSGRHPPSSVSVGSRFRVVACPLGPVRTGSSLVRNAWTPSEAMHKRAGNVKPSSHEHPYCRPCRKPGDDGHPITGGHAVDALQPSISDTIRSAPTSALITVTSSNNITISRTPPIDRTKPGVLSPSTITTNTPTSSDVDSAPTCPHCDRAFTSRFDLIGHLRIHRPEAREPVSGAPTCTRGTLLNCLHCHRTFIHLTGLLDHRRIHENLR